METIAEAVARALRQYQAGNLEQAEPLARAIVQAEPRQADALDLLGLVALRQHRQDQAVGWFRQAIAFRPDAAEFRYHLALAYRQAGQPADALASYREALRLRPDHAAAANGLGEVLLSQGQLEEAAAACRQAVRSQSTFALAHTNLGEALRRLGHLQDAEACLREALRLQPDHAQTHVNLGNALVGQGQLQEALACYRQALHLEPNHAGAHLNLGIAWTIQGQLDQAAASVRQALRVWPNLAEAHHQLGVILIASGQADEALACFEQAVRLKPDYTDAHCSLGEQFRRRGRLAEAAACYRRSLQSAPHQAAAHLQLGIIYLTQGKVAEAAACFQEVLRLRPNDAGGHHYLGLTLAMEGKVVESLASWERALALAPNPASRLRHALALPVIYDSLDELERYRRRLEENLARLLTADLDIADPVGTAMPLFFLPYQGKNDRDVQAALAALYARAAPSLHYVAPHCTPAAAAARRRRPIKIGFVSMCFHDHTIGQVYGGLLRQLSREDFRVVVFRFPGRDDPLARAIEESADVAVTLPLDLQAARGIIAAQKLDVLYYTDIGQEPFTYFLVFARLAPVQCVTWGHPVTTGIPTMDYYVSSEDLEPEDAAEHYTEQLVRLKYLTTYYHRPRLSEAARPRGHFGLDEDQHVYLCPQSLFKMHPEFDPLLGRILRADPCGQLLLFQTGHPTMTELVRARLGRTIPDVLDRVQFLPRQSQADFLHLVAAADVMLDTIHFGGGNTTYLALGVGTPVVTVPGRFLRSRITYACYRQMGVLDCVAQDADDYVRLAVRLGTDPVWRQEVRGRLAEHRHALYENAAAVRELERFLIEAVDRAAESRPGSAAGRGGALKGS